MLAYCGIKCSECDAYIATQADDAAKLTELAENAAKLFKKEMTPEDVKCDGCKAISGIQISFCNQCKIRACAIDKAYDTCAECDEMETCETVAFIHKHNSKARDTLLELKD
ncbi:DUF3795 domain-containing protein [candidate division WOR-3 bacterium]|nr:DUF3795 domain-containing protein [candidate division WOR-3 bacterium]